MWAANIDMLAALLSCTIVHCVIVHCVKGALKSKLYSEQVEALRLRGEVEELLKTLERRNAQVDELRLTMCKDSEHASDMFRRLAEYDEAIKTLQRQAVEKGYARWDHPQGAMEFLWNEPSAKESK